MVRERRLDWVRREGELLLGRESQVDNTFFNFLLALYNMRLGILRQIWHPVFP